MKKKSSFFGFLLLQNPLRGSFMHSFLWKNATIVLDAVLKPNPGVEAKGIGTIKEGLILLLFAGSTLTRYVLVHEDPYFTSE